MTVYLLSVAYVDACLPRSISYTVAQCSQGPSLQGDRTIDIFSISKVYDSRCSNISLFSSTHY